MAELNGQTFDVVFLGTGLTECILSGVSSANKKSVLHTDPREYYGAETASLKLDQIFEKFPPRDEDEENRRKEFLAKTSNNSWSIDTTPKLLMYSGFFIDILTFTKVDSYLDCVTIRGSYVADAKNVPQKIPSSANEALNSKLVGLLDKYRLRSFLTWVAAFNKDDPKTYYSGYSPRICTMEDVYKNFGLNDDTKSFIGHSMALHTSDAYLTKPGQSVDTIERIKLYASSMIQGYSPYKYPKYGLGDIPQAFARLSGIYGATFILTTKLLSIEITDGAVSGVRMEHKSWDSTEQFSVKCDKIVADPSYFLQADTIELTGEGAKDLPKPNTYIKQTGEFVVKAICIVQDNKIDEKMPKHSMQLIIPKPKNTVNDIYLVRLDSDLGVSPPGHSVVIVSCICARDAVPEVVLKPGLDLIASATLFRMVQLPTPLYKPVDSSLLPKGLYISNSYDASTHFESAANNVRELYKRMYGQSLEELFVEMKKKDEEARKAEIAEQGSENVENKVPA